MAIKIDPLDRLMSRYIRTNAGWKCERCGKQYQPPTQSLHNSHYYGRRKQSVRFEPDNCDALCYGCHQVFGEHREDWTDRNGKRQMGYTSWKKEKLGEARFHHLTLQANTPRKPDRFMIKLWLTQKMKEFPTY